MKFQIEKLTTDSKQVWNEFCAANPDAWFWHTTEWLEYISNRSELKPRDLSLIFYKDRQIVALVPLVAESYQLNSKTWQEFSFEHWGMPMPVLAANLTLEQKELLEKEIFKTIDSLAEKNNIWRARFISSALTPNFLNNQKHFNLSKFDYQDTSLSTRIIDFHLDKDKLWKELRRNHQRNIRKATGMKVRVFTDNITPEIFEAYKKTHHRAAGRQTRPDKTFKLMYNWLKKDLGFLAVVEFNQKLIGFEYYTIYKNNVYGFSAANDPDYEAKHPIRHLLEWQAILWMKKQGYDYYEIGLQQHKILPYDFPDEKQINISHFKKGFGGFESPQGVYEKFYNENYSSEVQKNRELKYANKK